MLEVNSEMVITNKNTVSDVFIISNLKKIDKYFHQQCYMKVKCSDIMNRKVLYITTIAIVPLFLMFMASGVLNIQDVEALKEQVTYQYGIRTQSIVCGDHLCNPEKTVTAVVSENILTSTQVHDHLPEIQIVAVHNFANSDPNAYILTLKVTAGKQNIENISIDVVSDITTTSTTISSLFAEKGQIVVVRTLAMDPSSIHASVKAYHLN